MVQRFAARIFAGGIAQDPLYRPVRANATCSGAQVVVEIGPRHSRGASDALEPLEEPLDEGEGLWRIEQRLGATRERFNQLLGAGARAKRCP